MGRDVGPIIIVIGLAIVVVGLLAWSGALSWFGHLPGDIRIETDNTRIYVPWVSMLVVSAVISAVIWLVRR